MLQQDILLSFFQCIANDYLSHTYRYNDLNCLHGPPNENKLLHRDDLKGLLPYIRVVGVVVAAAHDGYSRLGFLSPGFS